MVQNSDRTAPALLRGPSQKMAADFIKAAAFDPGEIENFRTGIMQRDVLAVERALDAGVSMDIPVRQGLHALQILLYDIHSERSVRNRTYPHSMTRDQYNEETSKLVDLLLSRGVDLVAPQKYMTSFHYTLTDHFLSSQRFEDASKAIIQAIYQKLQQGGGVYQPDLEKFVQSWVRNAAKQGNDDTVEMVADALRQYKSIHDIVRMRLEQPGNAVEAELAYKYGREIGNVWLEEFDPPPVQMFMTQRRSGHDGGMHQDDDGAGNPLPASLTSGPKDAMGQLVTVMKKRQPGEVLAEIDRLVGLETYKDDALDNMLMEQLEEVRKGYDLKSSEETRNIAFFGNPGVGKTVLARLDAQLNHAMGYCGPRYAEITRDKVIAAHIGGTEVNFKELIAQADYIFIDEFSSFVAAGQGRNDKQDFGHRVIEALLPVLENDRTNKIFAFADYPKELMDALNSNSGIRRRIGRFLHIPDPTWEQLGMGIDKFLEDKDYKMEPEAKQFLLEQMKGAKEITGEKHFGNYGIARTAIEKLPKIIARRLFAQNKGDVTHGIFQIPSKEETMLIKLEDVKKLDLKEVLGLNEYKKIMKEGTGKDYGGTRIGFTAHIQ